MCACAHMHVGVFVALELAVMGSVQLVASSSVGLPVEIPQARGKGNRLPAGVKWIARIKTYTCKIGDSTIAADFSQQDWGSQDQALVAASASIQCCTLADSGVFASCFVVCAGGCGGTGSKRGRGG